MAGGSAGRGDGEAVSAAALVHVCAGYAVLLRRRGATGHYAWGATLQQGGRALSGSGWPDSVAAAGTGGTLFLASLCHLPFCLEPNWESLATHMITAHAHARMHARACPQVAEVAARYFVEVPGVAGAYRFRPQYASEKQIYDIKVGGGWRYSGSGTIVQPGKEYIRCTA